MALFTPLEAGELKLKHRVVLAPLTRMRAAEPSLAPSDLAVEYYRQRASEGGLLISEATLISMEGNGTPSAPGIFTEEQVAGWRRVTEAVHAKGGMIMCQLWHQGRVAHPSFADHPLAKKLGGPKPSASAGAVGITNSKGKPGKTMTYKGPKPHAVPRPFELEEIPRLVDDYRRAARNAMRAGFDGVEVHSAHGYLIDQFLCDGVNNRTDAYGGSIPNRIRLLLEVTEACVAVWGPGRVAVRLSPLSKGSMTYYGTTTTDPLEIYSAAVSALNRFPLAYLLLTEPRWSGRHDGNIDKDPSFGMDLVNGDVYRKLYKGTLMGSSGFTPASAARAVEGGTYDVIAFGRWFISNPDLPEKIRSGAPLSRYNRATFYSPGPEGYTDYPRGTSTKYPPIEQSKIGVNLKSAKL